MAAAGVCRGALSHRAYPVGMVAEAIDGSGLAPKPEQVERWESFGGTWRVASLAPKHAVIALMRCDGGETVDFLTLESADHVRWAGQQAAASALTRKSAR